MNNYNPIYQLIVYPIYQIETPQYIYYPYQNTEYNNEERYQYHHMRPDIQYKNDYTLFYNSSASQS